MMRIAEALAAFKPHRGDAIVVPGRGGKFWVELTGNEKLDVPLGDPAMGGHAGFALGLALAQPNRKVVLFDSEGDILMSLGMLATIAEQAPANFYHFLLDNEVYATTGGQPVPNAKNVRYDRLALAAGYPRAQAFDKLDDLDRARSHGDLESGPLKLVADKLLNALTGLGLAAFGAEGDDFDPVLHEAVQHEGDGSEGSKPVIGNVMRQGYKLGDQVLRHALVGVVDTIADEFVDDTTKTETADTVDNDANEGEHDAESSASDN